MRAGTVCQSPSTDATANLAPPLGAGIVAPTWAEHGVGDGGCDVFIGDAALVGLPASTDLGLGRRGHQGCALGCVAAQELLDEMSSTVEVAVHEVVEVGRGGPLWPWVRSGAALIDAGTSDNLPGSPDGRTRGGVRSKVVELRPARLRSMRRRASSTKAGNACSRVNRATLMRSALGNMGGPSPNERSTGRTASSILASTRLAPVLRTNPASTETTSAGVAACTIARVVSWMAANSSSRPTPLIALPTGESWRHRRRSRPLPRRPGTGTTGVDEPASSARSATRRAAAPTAFPSATRRCTSPTHAHPRRCRAVARQRCGMGAVVGTGSPTLARWAPRRRCDLVDDRVVSGETPPGSE